MALRVVRTWLPAAIAAAGLLLIILGGDVEQGAGVVLVGSAVLVVLANALLRLGLQSEREREEEQRRRDEGRWED